jgi:hypothetical protein
MSLARALSHWIGSTAINAAIEEDMEPWIAHISTSDRTSGWTTDRPKSIQFDDLWPNEIWNDPEEQFRRIREMLETQE